MAWVLAKVKSGRNETFRILATTDVPVYEALENMFSDTEQYDPATTLEEGQWYRIDAFSLTPYMIDVFHLETDTVDYDQITREELDQVQFICITQGRFRCCQSIGKARLLKKKTFALAGNGFEYREGSPLIIIEEYPDAVYDCQSDTLYFRSLSRISKIFLHITELYREATQEETQDFLNAEIIELGNGFCAQKVGTLNRRRIALALETLRRMNNDDRSVVFDYIDEYCPGMRNRNGRFSITNDVDLKLFLFGVEQRFYTTLVGSEKRIANSVISLTTE